MTNSFKWLVAAMALGVSCVVLSPRAAAAQCLSPEHCHNLSEGGQECFSGDAPFAFEECVSDGDFCQLSGGQCNPAFEYGDFPADVDLSPLGTFRSAAAALPMLAEMQEFRDCNGMTIQSRDPVEARPTLIVLE